jgi:hypothetical protein
MIVATPVQPHATLVASLERRVECAWAAYVDAVREWNRLKRLAERDPSWIDLMVTPYMPSERDIRGAEILAHRCHIATLEAEQALDQALAESKAQ